MRTARELAEQFCCCASREACALRDSQCSMLTAAIEARDAEHGRELADALKRGDERERERDAARRDLATARSALAEALEELGDYCCQSCADKTVACIAALTPATGEPT
jgi:hypothetical protein